MKNNLFLKVFRNKVINKLIFSHLYHIHREILKIKKVYHWNEVEKSAALLAGNGYVDLLKQYYRKEKNIRKLWRNEELLPIIEILKSKRLDTLKFVIKFFGIQELTDLIKSYGLNLYSLAAQYSTIDVIQYLDRLAMKSKEKIKWNHELAFRKSPLSNSFEILKHISTMIKIDLSSSSSSSSEVNDFLRIAIRYSIQVGRIDMIEFIVGLHRFEKVKWNDEIELASKYGHLEIVEWLHNNPSVYYSQSCTTKAMNLASGNGHLDIVKWLHEHRTEGCTNDAMDQASWNGHLDVVQWLHFNRTEGCTVYAIGNAARNGHLEIVKWLHENRTEGCSTNAMENAVNGGHLEVIKWLYENQIQCISNNELEIAASKGHLEVVKWLHQNRTNRCSTDAMDNAAKNGHLEIVKWLHYNRTEGCTKKAMDNAARYGHLEVIKWLHKNRYEGCSIKAIEMAAEFGHAKVIKWFYKHHFKGYSFTKKLETTCGN